MKFKIASALLFALMMSAGILAQVQVSQGLAVTQDSFHKEVVELYSFHPRDLKTGEEEDSKLQALDRFFKKVESEKRLYLPLLRAELRREDNPNYFYMDGSTLLVSLSEEKEDLELLLRGYARVDLVGLGGTMYVKVVHHCATKGLNTIETALHILSDPDFKAYISEHALDLDSGMALVFMLYPMEEEMFLPAVIQALDAQTNEKGMKALLLVLEVAATPEADSAIVKFSQDASKPEAARAFAKESMDLMKGEKGSAGETSEKQLRKQRRESMSRISDEALGEFMEITRKLRAKT